jgi:hypothetical protein
VERSVRPKTLPSPHPRPMNGRAVRSPIAPEVSFVSPRSNLLATNLGDPVQSIDSLTPLEGGPTRVPCLGSSVECRQPLDRDGQRRSESKADFIHKLRVAAQELGESVPVPGSPVLEPRGPI